jgi:hypothetical protein
VYAVVTFLHKDIFKKPIRLDWAGQFTKKTMKHMLEVRDEKNAGVGVFSRGGGLGDDLTPG